MDDLVSLGRECKICGEKRLSLMEKNARVPGGHNLRCKKCSNERKLPGIRALRGSKPATEHGWWRSQPLTGDVVRAGRECVRCGESALSLMSVDRSSIDGHKPLCKRCSAVQVSEARRQRMKDNPEGERARNKRAVQGYFGRHPEVSRELRRASSWRRRQNQTDEMRMAARLTSSRRRSRLRSTACSNASRAEIRALPEFCQHCGGSAENLDHIIPVVRGGCGNIHNLQWLCAPCNNRKHAKMPQRGTGCPAHPSN